MSPDTSIKSLLIKSTVPLEDTALSLYTLNTLLPFVSVRVIVSALPLSSDIRIEDTKVVVSDGQVYNVVAVAVVRSSLTFL